MTTYGESPLKHVSRFITRSNKMALTNVADENPIGLEGILILVEEGFVSNVDETLMRAHELFRRFVPRN